MVGNRARNHHWQTHIVVIEVFFDGVYRGFGIQGVENGFHHQQVHAAFYQAIYGFQIGFNQFVKLHIAKAWVVHIGRNRRGAVGGAQHTGHKTWLVWRELGEFIGQAARDLRRRQVDVKHQAFHAVIGLGDAGGVKRIGFNNVCARRKILALYARNHIGLREHQNVVIAFDVLWPVLKTLATEIFLRQVVALNHRAHTAVQQQDALF